MLFDHRSAQQDFSRCDYRDTFGRANGCVQFVHYPRIS